MTHYSVRQVKGVLYLNGKQVTNETPGVDEWWIDYDGVQNEDTADGFAVYGLMDDGVNWEWIAEFKHRDDAEMFVLEKEYDQKSGQIMKHDKE
jgi:hypothetical protein